LERYINVASDLFSQMVGRDLHYREDVAEKVASGGDVRLVVYEATPIDSITSIVIDDGVTSSTVDSDDYRIEDADAGLIEQIDGTWEDTEVYAWNIERETKGRQLAHYTVTYDGGWVTQEQDDNDGTLTRDLPYDIEQAVIDYVVMKDARRGRDTAVKSMSNLSASVAYMDQEVPPSFVNAVRRYKILEVL
jgi:hypothetical protein